MDTWLDTFFRLNAACEDYVPYALAFSLALLAFLRISNLVPASPYGFDSDRQLTMGDINRERQFLVIHLKWAKNLQRTDQFHIVRVPRLPNRPYMCPVRLFELVLHTRPLLVGAPLLMRCGEGLTEGMLRNRMSLILGRMGLAKEGITFHAFRRTGVTMAFANQVPLQAIRARGAWGSDAVWQYLKHTNKVTTIVPTALATVFN